MANTSKTGRGEWRITYDEDGRVINFELWDKTGVHSGGRVYEVFEVKPL